MRSVLGIVLTLSLALTLPARAAEPRARDLGIPFDFGSPGPQNAITDVPGVEVGHLTLIEGDSVRTGVTAILPRGKAKPLDQCFAGFFSLNGNGEMTGIPWLDERGRLEGPILLTNTNSVGVVRDAVIEYGRERLGGSEVWSLPVVAETWDGELNDIYGQHVKKQHAFAALDSAQSGALAEGGVGGGTGMIAFGFKGGIGTASRRLAAEDGGYTVGVLVQANFGRRHQLRIAGLPIGLELAAKAPAKKETGSIIGIVATDAPLLPHQLKALARRTALGMARTGGVGGDSSGDLFLAFSTANPRVGDTGGPVSLIMLPNELLDPLYEATVGASEEAIVNALVAGRPMKGFRGREVEALPTAKVLGLLARHGRLTNKGSHSAY